MIAADDDGRRHLAAAHEIVESQPGEVPLSRPQPADPRGKSLELHARFRKTQPAMQRLVVGKQLEQYLVGARDVLAVAAQRHPAKRPATLAELRPDVCGDESRVRERVREAAQPRLLSQ